MIIANDPDADRLAVAEKQPRYPISSFSRRARIGLIFRDVRSGSWEVFNGNEIGAMFAAWAWQCFLKTGLALLRIGGGIFLSFSNADPSSEQKSRAAMVTTAVSSKMIKAMADKEGFQFHVCLVALVSFISASVCFW